MKLLWLCNKMPGKIREAVTGSASAGGLWVDSVLQGLREQSLTIRVLCPGDGKDGALDDHCSFATFSPGKPYEYLPALEQAFRRELQSFQPEVIHIWGTEYAHTLAMVNACQAENLLEHMVISIQGLCSVYAGHYAEGLPGRVCRGWTFRDLLRWDNVEKQREKFVLRGELEKKALEKAHHVIGRTDWDRACVYAVNPACQYHFCNETLRQPFYQDSWTYKKCQKHRIFASSCGYPVKGFHYLLEAFREVVKQYPDATLAVTGESYLKTSPLRESGYHRYLAKLTRQYGLEGKIEFLGSLDAEGMKEAFLSSNVFVLPSTIENSPNSLGEAMVLGVPCVASDVGGVAGLMDHGQEGFVYQSTAPYMLAHYIRQVFAMGDRAGKLGQAAQTHGRKTHDPQENLRQLLEIYDTIAR